MHLDHLQSLACYGDRVDRFAIATPNDAATAKAIEQINSAAFGFQAHRSIDIAVEYVENFPGGEPVSQGDRSDHHRRERNLPSLHNAVEGRRAAPRCCGASADGNFARDSDEGGRHRSCLLALVGSALGVGVGWVVLPARQLVLPWSVQNSARILARHAVDRDVCCLPFARPRDHRGDTGVAPARSNSASRSLWTLMPFTLAWSSLRRHGTRTLLAMLGVAVAAAMLLDMVMMSTGMRESFRTLLLSRGFQLRLAPKGTLPFDTDATMGNTQEMLRALRRNANFDRCQRGARRNDSHSPRRQRSHRLGAWARPAGSGRLPAPRGARPDGSQRDRREW